MILPELVPFLAGDNSAKIAADFFPKGLYTQELLLRINSVAGGTQEEMKHALKVILSEYALVVDEINSRADAQDETGFNETMYFE